ncbi:condensation domain-containing protein [Streptomyces sp. NBC_00078]|uniref:condensation domain-containing protein n=1 Tax=unclassified Streptomyces TaxID=2593676 RepID=UPI0022595C1F|nr:condensation domain-containing protein [Streptomyces sp. NBC_00078]MCX5418166.1 condensation domain-containing protein [Streptomyces sp. NBC_00078]
MIPLAEYAPAPGELIEFQAVATAPAPATAAVPHPAPPSHLQESHLRQRLAHSGELPETWLGLFFDLPGRLDTKAMAAALAAWVRRHPTLLTWFALDRDLVRRHALSPEAVSFAPMSLGTHDTAEEIRNHLRTRFARGTDPAAWPPLVVCAIPRQTQSTIVLAVDHAHTDGLSILLAFSELRACYAAALSGSDARLPDAGSHVEFSLLERQCSARLDASAGEVAQWRDFLESGPFTGAFPLGIAPDTAYPAAAVTVDLFDASAAVSFARACRTQGADFLAGTLAAFASAGRALGGPDTCRALMLVHTRDERRWRYAQGWFVNTVPMEFSATGTFPEVLAAARGGVERARRTSGVTPARLTELLPELSGPLAHAARTLPLVSYLDLRSVRGAVDWADHNVNSLVAMGRTSVPRLWVNRLRDQTYLRIAHPDTSTARESVLRFAALVSDFMGEVAHSGETGGAPTPAVTATVRKRQ